MTVISEEYRKEQQHLHETNPNYGVASMQYGETVAQMCKMWGCTMLLDYGAGKQRLEPALRRAGFDGVYYAYDPAIPEIAHCEDEAYQFVACIDVLEHIEPDYLDFVLDDLQYHLHFRGLLTIHTGPAKKTLSDGRNAHLTQQPARWWLPKLCQRWEILGVQVNKMGCQVLVGALGGGLDS